MTISLIFAWIAALLCLATAFKYVARISGKRSLNRSFHKIHIPFGVMLLVMGLLHGLLAGNRAGATLTDLRLAPVLFTPNWGSACFLLVIFLGTTYMLRKKLKKRWMPLHRLGTAALLICLLIHLLNVGVRLPSRIIGAAAVTAAAEPAQPSAEQPSPEPLPEETALPSQEPLPEVSEPAEITPDVSFSGACLRDGVYTGSADGYNGPITVSVSVTGGEVTEIQVVSQSDSARNFSMAEGVTGTIVDTQSLEVDAVTGATYSSAGIIHAVYNALQDAVVSGTLTEADIDLR